MIYLASLKWFFLQNECQSFSRADVKDVLLGEIAQDSFLWQIYSNEIVFIFTQLDRKEKASHILISLLKRYIGFMTIVVRDCSISVLSHFL